jgi:hypothetical protein
LLPYCPYYFTIQPTFLPYFSHLFTIFFCIFQNLFTIRLAFLLYFPNHFTLFFYIFPIFSLFSSASSISFHYSTYLSSIFSKSFHYSAYLSSIFSNVNQLSELETSINSYHISFMYKLPRYNCNIVECGIKHHRPNPLFTKTYTYLPIYLHFYQNYRLY